MSLTRWRRSMGAMVGCIIVLAGCGGDGGDTGVDAEPGTTAIATTPAPATTSGPGTTAAPGTTQAPDDTDPPDDMGSSGEANKAVVTIGGGTYEFDVEMSIVGRCEPDFFGAFWVIASAADGSSGSLEMFIVPEGNANHDETSKVKVNLKEAEERDWRADADGGEGTPEGESAVDSFSIDGNTVTGTASFVDIYTGDGATAEGTFEATCP